MVVEHRKKRVPTGWSKERKASPRKRPGSELARRHTIKRRLCSILHWRLHPTLWARVLPQTAIYRSTYLYNWSKEDGVQSSLTHTKDVPVAGPSSTAGLSNLRYRPARDHGRRRRRRLLLPRECQLCMPFMGTHTGLHWNYLLGRLGE